MKQSVKILFFVIIAAMTGLPAISQQTPKPARHMQAWIPENGYWVIESNKKTPRQSVVHFYTNEGVQVYQEEVVGKKINLNKRKTRMRLKQVLDRSLASWQQDQPLDHNAGLLVSLRK